jgi:parallel beta-helix repeat protein
MDAFCCDSAWDSLCVSQALDQQVCVGRAGILVRRGKENAVQQNTANDNSSHGIVLAGTSKNKVRNNTAHENSDTGIRLIGASESVITNNKAFENFSWDLFDDAEDCGTNRWRFNAFDFANQDCID